MARTQAQTPAPKRDQIEGSSKNPKGSASGSRGGIKIGEAAIKSLENMRDKHNEKYKAKSKRVDLGTLKAVFRRGAGAFSTSHRPGMNRTQWALARVRAFLKLVGTGQRKESYNTDLDLLPKGHPQRTEAKSEALAVPDKYSHISFQPPKGAQDAAKRALEVRADKPPSQRGMTPVGIARARDLANGRAMSPETVKRMLAYFTRHEVDKQGSTWNKQGKGWQAWQGWGGDAGFAWARKVVKQMNAADNKGQALRAYGEAIQLSALPDYEVPEGLTIGKPFKTLALGQVSSRMNGESIGQAIDEDMLEEMVRVYKARRLADPVIIDWQHATSPFQGGSIAPPESGNALGMIVDLELREDGLYATPAYNERGLDVVKNAGGILWSSPEFLAGEVFDRAGGEKIGDAQLLAITLTPRPAQSHDRIDRVTLNERLEEMDNIESMSVEELKAALAAKHEMVLELEQKIKDMQAESEAALATEDKPEDEEKPQAMTQDEDEEKKKAQMSLSESGHQLFKEQIRNLEAQTIKLGEQLAASGARIEMLEAEKRDIEKRQAVRELLESGRITPAEETVVAKAFELREVQPEFWQMFTERSPASSVPLGQIGHGASGQEINKATVHEAIKALATEKSVTYSEALTMYRTTNPDNYAQAFGG